MPNYKKKEGVSGTNTRDILAGIVLITKDSKACATGEEESAIINATSSSSQTTAQKPTAAKINAKEPVELVHNMGQEEKDKVIQDVFMQEDFA